MIEQQTSTLLSTKIQASNPENSCPSGKSFFDEKWSPPTERLTPVDEFTGVPLVLMPSDDLPPVVKFGEKNIERIADWHHPFHPRAQLINKTKGLVALRLVRKQWTMYQQHHNELPYGYHSLYDGPKLPQTEEELFRTVVFSAAAYIPKKAIEFRKDGKRRFRRISDEQRSYLWKSGQIQIDNAIPVRDYLIDYLLNIDFVDIESSDVQEFLETQNLIHKQQLGNRLLRAAANESTDFLNYRYRKAKKEELIPRSKAHSAGQFVLSSINLAKGRVRAHDALERRLTAA